MSQTRRGQAGGGLRGSIGSLVVLAAICAACTPTSPTTAGASSATAPPSVTSQTPSDPQSVPATPLVEKRDFMFQVVGYRTNNQGGQRMNLYFHYRYRAGLPDLQIPNYEDLRRHALTFMARVDSESNPYWETLSQTMCRQLMRSFPIEAISCQLQVYPDDRRGLPYEPGYHSSIDTIGEIEPLAIPG